MSEVTEALANVLERYVRFMDTLGMATVESDPEWPSPCTTGEPDEEGRVGWQPVLMEATPDFRDVETAIGETLHLDVKSFYGSYWAAEVQARHGNRVVLLQTVWNPEDLARARAAMIDHVLARREALGSGTTIFIANTEGDLFFSVDNASGEVLLEEPGNPPQGIVAPSLHTFLTGLRVGRE